MGGACELRPTFCFLKDSKTPTSDTESQRKKRNITIDNTEPGNREIKRRVSLSDVPKILRHGDGSQLSGILQRESLHIGNAIQQLLDAKETESSAQILNSAIDDCNKKSPQKHGDGVGGIRKRDDFANEYGRWGESDPMV